MGIGNWILFIIAVLMFVILSIQTYKQSFKKEGIYMNYNLSKEDLDFLIELQHEMLTQDHVGQAAPRFWVVGGTRQVATGREYAEGEQLIHDTDVVADNLEQAVEYFKEYIQENIDEFEEEGVSIVIEKEDTSSFESYRVARIDTSVDVNAEGYSEQDEIIMEQNFITGIEELVEALVDAKVIADETDYSVGYYYNEHYRYPDTMFLTNRSCKEHIQANHYHYSGDAHSYAMTAWRSPEVSRLFDILDKIDWKAIKEGAYGISSETEGTSGKTDATECPESSGSSE